MSLLLLFPSGVAVPVTTFACWTVVGTNSSDWTVSHYDFFNLWSEWETLTWGTIESTGYTWAGMAGYTFTVATTQPTSWSAVTVATCS